MVKILILQTTIWLGHVVSHAASSDFFFFVESDEEAPMKDLSESTMLFVQLFFVSPCVAIAVHTRVASVGRGRE